MARDGHSHTLTPTILVVEEDASLRHSMRFSLAVEGFAVRTYANGNELLGVADLPDRGCFVVDYHLPDMTGLDLVASLRNRHIALPIILITTNPTAMVRRRAEEAGVPMIEKPLLGDSLIRGIVTALAQPARPSR